MKKQSLLITILILLTVTSCKLQEEVKNVKEEQCSYGLFVINNWYRAPFFYKFDERNNKFLYYYPLYVRTNREMYSYGRIDKPISEFFKEKKLKFKTLSEEDEDRLDNYTYLEVHICNDESIEDIAKKEDAIIVKEKLFEVLNKKVKNYRVDDVKPKEFKFVNPEQGKKYQKILDSLNSSPPSYIDSLI